jgi:vacuolar-type H+-ATPase subunit B/Vma2
MARTLVETLDLMWTLLEPFSDAELKRIPPALLERRKRAT